MDLPAISQQRVKGGGPVATATASPPRRPPPAFDLKGTMAPLTVLRLRSADLALVERQLRVKIAQLPHLFLQAPVLLDLGALEEASPLTIIDIVTVLKMCKLIPVAATNVPIALRGAIAESGLGILQASVQARPKAPDGAAASAGGAAAAPAAPVPPPPPARQAPAPAPAPFGGPMVVRQAVRGGQVVYAQNNDLVVLAPVNAGAQVIADGHVHIYSTLRGRAVAGANGLPGARIFVQKLEAELIAVSGSYVMAEEIPPQLRGRAVQAYLENGDCKLAPL
jgi:septum site-determining protein MinC